MFGQNFRRTPVLLNKSYIFTTEIRVDDIIVHMDGNSTWRLIFYGAKVTVTSAT